MIYHISYIYYIIYEFLQIQIFIRTTHPEYIAFTMNETLNYLQTNTLCNSKPTEGAIGLLEQDQYFILDQIIMLVICIIY